MIYLHPAHWRKLAWSDWSCPFYRDLSGLRQYSPIRIDAPGYTRHGNIIIWDRYNLKPARPGGRYPLLYGPTGRVDSDDICVSWVPAFRSVLINGHRGPRFPSWSANVDKFFDWVGLDFDDGSDILLLELSRRRGNEVWMPAILAAKWLKADFKETRRRGCRSRSGKMG